MEDDFERFSVTGSPNTSSGVLILAGESFGELLIDGTRLPISILGMIGLDRVLVDDFFADVDVVL